ncbi:hypothetical protein HDU90_008227 [Geranomyces variabilis]|nr:hypothetical protein HDU90_008227 [Geranomyces variabilis]
MHYKRSKARKHSYTPLALDNDYNIVLKPTEMNAEQSSNIGNESMANSKDSTKHAGVTRILKSWNSLTNMTAKGLQILSAAAEVPAVADSPVIWTAPVNSENSFIQAARITRFPSSSRLPAANTRGPLPPLNLPLPALKALGAAESWWAASVDRTAAAVARTAQFAGIPIKVKGSQDLIA